MKKINVLTEIAIFASLGFVLDVIQGAYSDALFATGGSIGVAGIVVIIIGLRHGFLPSLACGLIMGLLDLLDGFHAYTSTWYNAFFQVALDYYLGYTVLAFGALIRPLYRKKKENLKYVYALVAVLIGYSCKYFIHFLSGLLFWPDPDANNQIMYSLIYNGAYTIPCMVFVGIVLCLTIYKFPAICPKIDTE